jgi:hypothetical protein
LEISLNRQKSFLRNIGGFFDVFAWREAGEVRFDEGKVGPDSIRPGQLKSSSWRWIVVTAWTS